MIENNDCYGYATTEEYTRKFGKKVLQKVIKNKVKKALIGEAERIITGDLIIILD